LEKPVYNQKTRITEEIKAQFDAFFSDKTNVSMSSYKVDSQSELPILYLQDHKKNLWKAYSEMYPNGMSRTTFFLNLQNGRYKYREDLGGLCSICSDYGYNVFEDLNKVITKYINDETLLVIICNIICLYITNNLMILY